MNNNGNTLAIKGYDPVSYFNNQPSAGDPMLVSEFGSSTYYFSSEENKVRFDKNPEAYLPAYGGYCATAMSEGKLFDINPVNYKIVEDKLHLFYLGSGGDTKAQWEENEAERKVSADKIWAEGTYA